MKKYPLIYATEYVLVDYLNWAQEKEVYSLFASSDSYISEKKYQGLRYYKSRTVSDLVSKAKILKADKWWNKEEGKAYKVVFDSGKNYIWEGIYTNDAYTRREVTKTKPNWSKYPPTITPWAYWLTWV